jgi:hypothetical protein
VPTLSGTVTISGNAVFDETLTAITTGLTSIPTIPDLGTLSYQWKRGAVNIGTNSATYTLLQADIDNTITVTVTAANCDGEVTSAPTQPVSKATQTPPEAPTLDYKTATTITLNIIVGCEYRKDGGAWQTSVTFVGLTPDTEYGFEARKGETTTHLPSAPSEKTLITTDAEDEEKILQSIVQPLPITDLPNGTPKTAEALTLPKYVTLVTNLGNVPGTVTWNVNDCPYDPTFTTQQTFLVNGTVTLPEEVLNPNNIPLEVTISVTVDGKTGISNVRLSDVVVYPNPTEGQLIVNSKQLTVNNVEIMDVLGRIVKTRFIASPQTQSETIIDLSNLATGIYFIRIETETGTVVRKVVKQ